jgi:hypothetical protein
MNDNDFFCGNSIIEVVREPEQLANFTSIDVICVVVALEVNHAIQIMRWIECRRRFATTGGNNQNIGVFQCRDSGEQWWGKGNGISFERVGNEKESESKLAMREGAIPNRENVPSRGMAFSRGNDRRGEKVRDMTSNLELFEEAQASEIADCGLWK